MLTSRKAIVAIVMTFALAGAACGGGGDDDGEDVASSDSTTTVEDAVTTTTEATEDTEPEQSASDIKPCDLLPASELEAQASVANATSFKGTRQEAKPADARGMVRCDNYFTVVERDGGEITATLAVEVWPKNAANQYNLFKSANPDTTDVNGFGDKAYWAEENAWLVILDGSLLVKIDVGMPGVMKDTNQPVAEAVAPKVLGRL